MTKPMPQQTAPTLSVPTVRGQQWTLSGQRPDQFSAVVFYRGLHCPLCKGYLGQLNSKADAFRKRGVEPIAISMDGEERAQQAVDDWGLDTLTVGYGLTEDSAREWGLYISTSISEKETARFAEPGLFLIRPDNTLYAASIQSMPFARPNFDDLLQAVDFVVAKNYPPRGTAA
ncbi:MAG: AhpC/TSA family protein [Ectothiorhodospiraceae bacterium]|nr:AhpC/TSA family protein [Ectothiorhodospiraceae bacterium]